MTGTRWTEASILIAIVYVSAELYGKYPLAFTEQELIERTLEIVTIHAWKGCDQLSRGGGARLERTTLCGRA